MKIMIGVPGFAGVQPECQETIGGLLFRLGRETDYDVAFKIAPKSEQFRARNKLVTAAISGGFDYLLMLDDDMRVPHDLVQRLLAHDKDVVGALYYQRGGLHRPVVMDEGAPNEYGEIGFGFWSQLDPRIIDNPGLHPCDVIGGGCMLFKVEVFGKLVPPYFHPELDLGTDIHICKRLREVGYQPYVDTSIELGHLGNKEVITSRSLPTESRVFAEAAESLGKDVEVWFQMPADWVNHEIDLATTREKRKLYWGERSSSWEDVRSYYQDNGGWHILNLSGFAIREYNACRAWVLNEGVRSLTHKSIVLDYGCGVGFTAIPLANKCSNVYAVDVQDAPTLEFVRWRAQKNGVSDRVSIVEVDDEYPRRNLPHKLDGACMISVLDHLTSPYETVEWIAKQMKPGAWFVCDWMFHSHNMDEPQHLDRYDIATFREFLYRVGFVESPEHAWLWVYRGGGHV